MGPHYGNEPEETRAVVQPRHHSLTVVGAVT